MIKKLIFDIDNTLIKWKKEYYENMGEVFKKLNIKYNEEDIHKIADVINNKYELNEKMYNKKAMMNAFNRDFDNKLPESFIQELLDYFCTCIPKKLDNDVIDTLKYLSSKYELVTLTNWFGEVQEVRLKELNILQYFKEMYTCENFYMKPYKESFIKAANGTPLEECVMIGDSIEKDVKGAINARNEGNIL